MFLDFLGPNNAAEKFRPRFPQSPHSYGVRQRFFWIPQPTPTSSQRNTSGRAGWKRLGPVVTMRSRSLGRRGFRMLVMSRIRHAATVPEPLGAGQKERPQYAEKSLPDNNS